MKMFQLQLWPTFRGCQNHLHVYEQLESQFHQDPPQLFVLARGLRNPSALQQMRDYSLRDC